MIFILTTSRSLFLLKDLFPLGFTYLLHFLSYGNINLTPCILFVLGFNAISHSYLIIIKGLRFYKNYSYTPIPLYHTHISWQAHTFHIKIYISNYLNVTSCTRTEVLRPQLHQDASCSSITTSLTMDSSPVFLHQPHLITNDLGLSMLVIYV
jgi:hypothetical protein